MSKYTQKLISCNLDFYFANKYEKQVVRLSDYLCSVQKLNILMKYRICILYFFWKYQYVSMMMYVLYMIRIVSLDKLYIKQSLITMIKKL